MIFPEQNNKKDNLEDNYDIETIVDNVVNIPNDCPVCLVTITNEFKTPCGHTFCAPCIAEALVRNPTCPVCRSGNIHTCVNKNYDCTLCNVGHVPGDVVPNIFVNHRYSPFAHMTFYELIIMSFKVVIFFTVQLIAGILCYKNIITLIMFCLISFITTIINMLIISECSLPLCRYRCNQIWQLLQTPENNANI